MSGKRRPPLERFWPKVDLDGPLAANDPSLGACWVWTGNVGSGPYGLFWDGDHMMNAHRFAWSALIGPPTAGMVLDHFACDNKLCVNPTHLREVTQRENTLRSTSVAGVHAAATACPHGHPYDDENTYRRPDGKGRGCLACRRSRKVRMQ